MLSSSLIQSKHSPQMVLTITMPVKQQKNTDANILTYAGCSVTLQKRKICQLGSANQKWRYDPETGLIHAFFTDVQDKGKFIRMTQNSVSCIFHSYIT